VLTAPAERLKSWAAEWARRRQGDDALAVTLKRRRIYILPTAQGIAFAAMLFAMLLGSLQYGANLGFALTFLLAGLGLVAMNHCHNNLLGITVRFTGAEPVFVGQEIRIRLHFASSAPTPRLDILATNHGSTAGPLDLPSGSTADLFLHERAVRRGMASLGRFSVSTRFPGNLFRAWSWIHMDARALVYPSPAPPGRPLPVGKDTSGPRAATSQEEDDFVGLREATPHDPPRQLAWKAFARTDQLLVKQFAGGSEQPCLFEFDDLTDLDVESRLSQLTRWCLDAAESQRSFGLVLPGQTIPLGRGDRHLHTCLRALALYPGAP